MTALTQEPGSMAWFLYTSKNSRYRVSVVRHIGAPAGSEFTLEFAHEHNNSGYWMTADPTKHQLQFPEKLLAPMFRAIGDAVGATEAERLAAVGEVAL